MHMLNRSTRTDGKMFSKVITLSVRDTIYTKRMMGVQSIDHCNVDHIEHKKNDGSP